MTFAEFVDLVAEMRFHQVRSLTYRDQVRQLLDLQQRVDAVIEDVRRLPQFFEQAYIEERGRR
jgi:hypothetical protein